MKTKAAIKSDSNCECVARWLVARRNLLSIALWLIFAVFFSAITIAKPIYEWDLIAYLANSMLIAQEQAMGELHKNVYRVAAQSLPADAYEWLVGSPSRLILSEDPEALWQTMTFFYDARVVYNYLIAGLIEAGLNPVFALYSFSTLCVVISMLLLVKLIPGRTPMGMHIIVPFIVPALGLMTVARLATPDALAALTIFALYFLLLRNRINTLLILSPLVIFIRTDLILLVAIFQVYFLLCNRVSRVRIILSGAVTIGAYLVLNLVIVEADAWSALIGYNFGEKPTHPAEYVFHISIMDYFGYLWIGVLSFTYNPLVFVFFLLTAIGLVLFTARFFDRGTEFRVTQLHANLLFILISSFAYFLLHFLLFPVSWVRFFTAQYSIVAVVVCWIVFSQLSSHRWDSGGIASEVNPPIPIQQPGLARDIDS